MKKIMVVLLLVSLLFIVSGCYSQPPPEEDRITSAFIRYFDGSSDRVVVEEFRKYNNGMVGLTTDTGRKIVIGVNNIIIIEESRAQYDCLE